MCEDGPGENFVIGITAEGGLYRLARNAYNGSELAGACMSPDLRTLFVNLREPGITFAIQGSLEPPPILMTYGVKVCRLGNCEALLHPCAVAARHL